MKKIAVIGATNIDLIARCYNDLKLYDKNPGISTFSYGGVARNICENLARLETNPTFITIIGNDEFGKGAKHFLEDLGTDVINKSSDLPTSTFISILDKDFDNYISISSMKIVDELDEAFLKQIDYSNFEIIVSDANSSEIAKFLAKQNKTLVIDATSDAKCRNIIDIIDDIDYLKCTKTEAELIFNTSDLEKIVETHCNLTLIVTNKSDNIIYNIGKDIYTHNIIERDIVSAIGAGDSFTAGLVYGLSHGLDLHKCIEIASKCAYITIGDINTVSTKISRNKIGELNE